MPARLRPSGHATCCPGRLPSPARRPARCRSRSRRHEGDRAMALRTIRGTTALDDDLLDSTLTLRFRHNSVLTVPADRTIAARLDMNAGGRIVVAAGATL